MKNLVLVMVFLIGCSSATDYAKVERSTSEETRNEVKSLENELMLNLWLHLKDEEARLTKKLEASNLTISEQRAIKTIIKLVQFQSQETWTLLYD